MDVFNRFLHYVQVDTPSDPRSATAPSTEYQWALARMLEKELKEMGVSNVRLSDTCYVYGEIPATAGMEAVPPIGFIAHMDTAAEFNGIGVKPQVIENYDGGDIPLKGSGHILSPKDYKSLADKKGKTLVTTDGTTLLGGDDKAGVAEIMAMAEELLRGDMPHGKVCIGFTPDEEIGRGTESFDIPGFGAKFAYTVDGGPPGLVSYENFNAAGAVVELSGVSTHPGGGKDHMVNSILVGMELNAMLPAAETPAHTADREGFYHLNVFNGTTEHTRMEYILRDHDAQKLERRKEMMQKAADFVNAKYGDGTAKLTLKEQYRNMAEKITPHMHLVDNALAAADAAGLKGAIGEATRGGTDGARLSFEGLPCPNLGTGCYNGHGRFEYGVKEEMEQCAQVLVGIVKAYAENPPKEA